MKPYQVKLKVSASGCKNMFLTGISSAKTPGEAKAQAVERVKLLLEKRNKMALKVEATKCILIKTDFNIKPNKQQNDNTDN